MKKDKEKEKQEKLKALRRELEDKIADQLPAELLSDEKTGQIVEEVLSAETLTEAQAKRVVEVLLFASGKPVTLADLRRALKLFSPAQIKKMLDELREDYAQAGHSFEMVEIANGYEMVTKKEYAPWLLRMEAQKKERAATASALETLAILAYRQPVTRAEIEDLRGVDAGGVLNTLMKRNLVKIVGKKEVPGRPFLYGTTEKFLEHFGLKSLKDLPSLEEIKKLVETSIKKEELIGTQNIVEVPKEGEKEEEHESGTVAQEN